MNEHFDAVVVGSGFGGSVMAYELANAGMRVCLLERGNSYPPGSFARSPFRMGRNFWDPSEGYYGLFDVWSFQHSEAIVSSGLGGGSLIYANVLLRKPEDWFVEKMPDGSYTPWPVSRKDLEEHYDACEKVLGANQYPLATEPYKSTPKMVAFRAAADALHKMGANAQPIPLNLAVTFASRPGDVPIPGEPIAEKIPNLHGRTRLTCRLCGECDVGCNYGSKNTLDYNYLTLAAAAMPFKCDIRHLCEVKTFRTRAQEAGYEVEYVKHDPKQWEGKKWPKDKPREKTTLTADYLILSAGTLGSTYLLLRNADAFPKISREHLGSRYSTNGDLLTFALRCQDRSQNPAIPKIVDPSRGPVITSGLLGKTSDHGGFYLQDAGYPEFVNWLAEVADAGGWFKRTLRFVWRRFMEWLTGEPHSEIDGQLAQLIGACELSSGSLPLLGMGRDTPDGRMFLRPPKPGGTPWLQVDWRRHGSAEFFQEMNLVSRLIAREMGGDFVENPDTKHLGRLVSVHPLGGAPMGETPDAGVVNSQGEVFGYSGLYVADGAIMPGPVGANPSLTIAALARRSAHSIIEKWRKR